VADATVLPERVRSVDDVFSVLDYTLVETVGLENSVQRNRALVTLAGAYMEAIRVGELEERLEALERWSQDVNQEPSAAVGTRSAFAGRPHA